MPIQYESSSHSIGDPFEREFCSDVWQWHKHGCTPWFEHLLRRRHAKVASHRAASRSSIGIGYLHSNEAMVDVIQELSVFPAHS